MAQRVEWQVDVCVAVCCRVLVTENFFRGSQILNIVGLKREDRTSFPRKNAELKKSSRTRPFRKRFGARLPYCNRLG